MDDSHRFILDCFDQIQDSPSYIYHYALPFAPSSSFLHQYYGSVLSQEVKVIAGLSAEWGMCFHTVSDYEPYSSGLACWNSIIATGSLSGDILVFDSVTRTQRSVLHGHSGLVRTFTFSSDGALLVSGSDDNTVKIWDFQTGGVIRTLCGHTNFINSVSISSDSTMVGSASQDQSIRLWDIQTGDCVQVIEGHTDHVNSVMFSPINPHFLISASDDGTVCQWDIQGHQIGPKYEGTYVTFSPDGSNILSWDSGVAVIRSSDSGEILAKLHVPDNHLLYCCFSPNGGLVAGCAGNNVYVWDITGSDPQIIKTLVGHDHVVVCLAFSSSILYTSAGNSIKLWQINASDPPVSDSIQSISLQTENNTSIISDSSGVVRIWDVTTGICKASFQTPCAGDFGWRDAQLTDAGQVLVWGEGKEIHIWNVKEGKPIRRVEINPFDNAIEDLRISGDGSKVFLLDRKFIHAWSIGTGETVGEVRLEEDPKRGSLIVEGSKVWVGFSGSPTQGWDFGVSGSTVPTPLSDPPLRKSHLDFVSDFEGFNPSVIKDTVTGKEVFQLPGRYRWPTKAQWDGQYLVAGYKSGEVLILDFKNVFPQ